MSGLQTSMIQFVTDTLAGQDNELLKTEYDSEWRSKCEVRTEGGLSLWKPCRQDPPISFDGLANAIEGPIHPDIITFYSTYWSGSLQAQSDEGPASLIQLWNQDDFDRLVANLIGHYLHQKKQKLAFTVFFATTDPDSELFLSIDNQTGHVMLEEPGRAPIRQVETDLDTFIKRLTPVTTSPEIF